MRSITVADFCARSAEVLDDLRAKEIPYVVTSGDEPVAILSSPLDAARSLDGAARKARAAGGGWESYLDLAESLRESWPAERDSGELLRRMRGGEP